MQHRTHSSVRNFLASVGASIATVGVGLVVQKVFLDVKGTEYLGINGLFTNIMTMFGMVELGLGNAIVYHLYKPLAHNDSEKVRSLLGFYRVAYRAIAGIVITLGLLLTPLLHLIVGKVHIHESIYLIFSLFVIDIVASYLLTYKRSLLFASQKSYLVNIVHIGALVVLNVLQIIFLIKTHNYIAFLVIKIGMRLVENMAINMVTVRLYPYIREKHAARLDDETRKDIFQKIRGLFFHKIGTFFIFGTDNIVISIFLGVKTVGLYSNYYLVFTAITTIVGQAFSALTASVGNLLITSDARKSYEVYRKMRFANFWLATFSATGFLVVMDSFVRIWLGGSFILSTGVLVALAANLYSTMFRAAINSYKEAAGIFYEDRFVPLIESVVNIGMSILLLHFFGLAGVFLGTLCSSLALHLYSYPHFVYTRLFKKTYGDYFRELARYTSVAFLVGVATFWLSRIVTIHDAWLQFGARFAIAIVVPNVLLWLIYRNSTEYKYFKQLAQKIFKRLLTYKHKLRLKAA
ncbi:MAG: polysaccharide transporter [Candidatus Doudnabacteria bacterium]|nr:polysaccharide transporter [Candidatus Doudnabacteria bacterium]